MANLDGMAAFKAFLRQLETTDPKHPDTWNPNYQDLINNDVYLKGEVDSAKGDAVALSARVDSLALNDPIIIQEAVSLDWLYNQNRILFDLFSGIYTLVDTAIITGVSTVMGDDSVDISDTSTLTVGGEYVIFDEGSSESIEVLEILTLTRFKATAALALSFDDVSLARTNFDLSTPGQAVMTENQIYYSKILNLGNNENAAFIMRHNGGAGDLLLYYKDDDHAAWTAAPWKWQRDMGSGVIDVEYPVAARGDFTLKLVCVAVGPIVLDYIVGVGADTGLSGTHHAPATPANDSPADLATDINETPTLAVVNYTSVVDANQYGLQVQISTDADDWATAIVHDSGDVAGGTSYTVPAGILAENGTYYWRMRQVDVESAWSAWSTATSFTAAASFDYVRTPVNDSPAAGAADIPETPTVSGNPFDVSGAFQLSLSDGATDKWTDSPTTAGEYYYNAAGVTDKPLAVYAAAVALAEGTLGSLVDGEWAWGDQDTLGTDKIYVKLAVGDPDAQAADYLECSDSHSKSQWQVRAASGDYDAATYDSGESVDLTSHIVPAGKLLESQTTYYFRVRYQGANLGWSEWSQETNFVTKDVFAAITGIALIASGGGAGTWQRVDDDGNNKITDAAYFNNHPVFGGIVDVTIDSQAMVKIPQFYYKRDVGPVGSDQEGKKCLWISDQPVAGYTLHPAFMDAGVEIDQYYVGKYECTDDAGTKAGSIPGVLPLVSIDFPTMQARCAARNTGGVEGFMLWDIYQLAAIQMLCLIENGGPDVQSTIGAGNTVSAAAVSTGTTNAVWRGISELWGNVYHMTDGLQGDIDNQIKIFDQLGNGTYVATAVTASTADGWAISMHNESGTGYDLNDIYMPQTVDTTESNGTFGDYLYAFNLATDNVCFHGGYRSSGSYAGLFCLYLLSVASDSYTSFGGRLAKR